MEPVATILLPIYEEFRQHIVLDQSQNAEECWESLADDDKELLVWQAATNIDVDVLRWTLVTRDSATRLDACHLRHPHTGDSVLHVVVGSINHTAGEVLTAAKMLIEEALIDVDVKNDAGLTPLHLACGSHLKRDESQRQDYLDLLRLFVENGANLKTNFDLQASFILSVLHHPRY